MATVSIHIESGLVPVPNPAHAKHIDQIIWHNRSGETCCISGFRDTNGPVIMLDWQSATLAPNDNSKPNRVPPGIPDGTEIEYNLGLGPCLPGAPVPRLGPLAGPIIIVDPPPPVDDDEDDDKPKGGARRTVKSTSKARSKAKSKSAGKAKPKAKSKPKAKPKAKGKAKPKAKGKAKPKAKGKAKPKTRSKSSRGKRR